MKENEKSLKSGVWYTASNVLVKGIGFITTPIFTRLLTQAEYGEFSNFVSWISIMSIIITLVLNATLMTAKYDYKEKLDTYVFSILALGTLSVICWGVFLNCFHVVSEIVFDMHMKYINAMLLYIFGHMVIEVFQAREQYRYAYKSSATTALIVSVGSSLLSVLLVMMMQDKLAGRVIGYVLPVAVGGMGLVVYFGRKGKIIDFSCWWYALKICLPYIFHSLSMVILSSVDRIMIRDICGAEDTALYSLAGTCTAIITLFTTSMNNAFAPWMGERLHNSDYVSINGILKKYIGCFCGVSVAAMLVTPEIVAILGGKEYISSVYVMPPLIMGCFCQFVYCIFVNVEQFNKKTMIMAIGSIVVAFANYILNLVFIPLYGYHAAAYTTMLSYFLLMLIHMLIVFRMGLSAIANYKMVFGYILMMFCITFAVNCLFKYTVLRYIIIVFCVAVGVGFVIRYRKVIRNLLNTVLLKK